MKAAIYNGPGPLILSEVMTPMAGPNKVMVKVKTCGICHTDVNMVKGTYFPRKKPPLIMGHELAGIIAEMGSGLDRASLQNKRRSPN